MDIFVVHFKLFWLTKADSEVIPVESVSPKHMQNPILFDVLYVSQKLVIMFYMFHKIPKIFCGTLWTIMVNRNYNKSYTNRKFFSWTNAEYNCLLTLKSYIPKVTNGTLWTIINNSPDNCWILLFIIFKNYSPELFSQLYTPRKSLWYSLKYYDELKI